MHILIIFYVILLPPRTYRQSLDGVFDVLKNKSILFWRLNELDLYNYGFFLIYSYNQIVIIIHIIGNIIIKNVI